MPSNHTHTERVAGRDAPYLVCVLVNNGKWFEYSPLPDGRCDITVQNDPNVIELLQRALQAEYLGKDKAGG